MAPKEGVKKKKQKKKMKRKATRSDSTQICASSNCSKIDNKMEMSQTHFGPS